MGFAKMGADGSRVSTFCFSIWLHIQQDVINLTMCKSSTFIYKFSFGLPGGRNSISPTSASPIEVCGIRYTTNSVYYSFFFLKSKSSCRCCFFTESGTNFNLAKVRYRRIPDAEKARGRIRSGEEGFTSL